MLNKSRDRKKCKIIAKRRENNKKQKKPRRRCERKKGGINKHTRGEFDQTQTRRISRRKNTKPMRKIRLKKT